MHAGYSSSDGVPDASIWLNETIDSSYGTFVPLLAPAFVLNRFYLLTAFWPHDGSGTISTSFHLRLYAIDVLRELVEKFKTAWYYDVQSEGYVPSVKERFDSCKLSQEGEVHHSTPAPFPVGNVMAINDTVIAHVNFIQDNSSGSVLLSLNDTGESYEKNFLSITTTAPSIPLSLSHPPFQLKNGQEALPLFIVSYKDKFQLVDQYKGNVIDEWSLHSTLSSPPLILQTLDQTSSFYMIFGQTEPNSVTAMMITLKGTSWKAIAVWFLPIPGNRFATVTNGNQTLLVVCSSDRQLTVYGI